MENVDSDLSSSSLYASALDVATWNKEEEEEEEKEKLKNGLTTGVPGTELLGKDEDKEVIDELKFVDEVTKKMLVLQLISILLYSVDVISDHVLAIQYLLNDEQIWYGIFTLTCIFLPSVWITYRGQKWRGVKNHTWKDWLLVFLILIFNMEPVVQYYYNYKTASKYLKAKKNQDLQVRKECYELLIARKRDVAQLRYWEGVLEAVPQLILQLYILLSNYETLQVDTTLYLQLLSLVSSTLGLAFTFYNYGKTWVILKGIPMSSLGHIQRCLRWFLPMVSRILSIVLLSVAKPIYVGIILVIHFLASVLWRYITHINQGWAVVIVQSLIDIIISRDDTLINVITSNLIIFLEDTAMMIIWACAVTKSQEILVLPMLCFIGILGFVGRILHIANKWYLYKYESKHRAVVE